MHRLAPRIRLSAQAHAVIMITTNNLFDDMIWWHWKIDSWGQSTLYAIKAIKLFLSSTGLASGRMLIWMAVITELALAYAKHASAAIHTAAYSSPPAQQSWPFRRKQVRRRHFYSNKHAAIRQKCFDGTLKMALALMSQCEKKSAKYSPRRP